MSKKREIYVCELCGNIIEILEPGDGELVCCGQEMTLQNENSVDASKEKHVPVVTLEGDLVHISIGSVPHPMESAHYIMWIEVWEGDRVKRQYLKPGDEPKATFTTEGGTIIVREYCNIHGLWIA